MHRDDRTRLRHMLDAAKEAIAFTKNESRNSLDANRMLVLSLVRLIEILGEAANQVSREFQAKNSGIPWPQIIAMRNRLIHAYFDIDLERLWDTVKEDLPPLVKQLEEIQ
ncbi:MAG: DUF86 domain-containing protein [Deltaproteobacteria bacterium]|nr:DUF86 domain-containing protein [Deltaproteobacteria bacterium]